MIREITSARVARNALWNVAGVIGSTGVGLLALPLLLHALGASRLGVFTLALGLIGFSGLLDLGLGRSLTQTVASALGAGRPRAAVAALVWHTLQILGLFGILWALLLWWALPLLMRHLLHLPNALETETLFGLRTVALSMPFALVASGAMGALEGIQAFRHVSTRRTMLSVVQFGLPTLAALLRPDLGWAIAALAASRVVAMTVWLVGLRQLMPRERNVRHVGADLRHLIHFGGWLSLSNIIGPLMVYADRFYLASLFSPAQVVWYTVPYDGVSRLTSLPMTALNAVFPALAEVQQDPARKARMVHASARAILAFMLPVTVFATAFTPELLSLWLGADFATHAARILQLLLLGVLLNSCAHLPYAALHAQARVDLTAQLHLLELPLFVLLLVGAVWRFGIEGAAIAWTLRVAVDMFLLYGAAWLLQPGLRAIWSGNLGVVIIGAVTVISALWLQALSLRIGLVIVVCLVCGSQLWYLARRWRRPQAGNSAA